MASNGGTRKFWRASQQVPARANTSDFTPPLLEMMDMRVGSYEIRRSNQWCYQVYRVISPVKADGKPRRRKLPVASDGMMLDPLECYPDTLAAALRKVAEFETRDGIDDAELMEVAARVESVRDEISRLADEIAASAGEVG